MVLDDLLLQEVVVEHLVLQLLQVLLAQVLVDEGDQVLGAGYCYLVYQL